MASHKPPVNSGGFSFSRQTEGRKGFTLKILINADKAKTEFFSKITNHEFVPVNTRIGEVVILLPETSFDGDLDTVLGLNIPVVVIAGNLASVVAKAREVGIPDECILVKRGDRTMSADGSVSYGSAKKGIPLRAAVEAVERAVKNNLYPEVLIWQETDQAETKTEKPAQLKAEKPATAQKPEQPAAQPKPEDLKPVREDIYSLAGEVIAVFRTVPGADSGRVSHEIAKFRDGVHLELSAEPVSWRYYGQTFQESISTSRYVHFNGTRIFGRYLGSRVLVVEVDPLLPSPEALDEAYQKASKIVHVASGVKESVEALTAWVKSGWRLDAVLAEKDAYDAIKAIVNVRACASVEELLRKI